MTSRERVTATLNHQEPDELAIDFGGMRSTGIHIIAYNQLVKHLGLSLDPPRLYDVFQQLAEPQPEVVACLGGDVVQAHQRHPAFGIAIDGAWHPYTLKNGDVVQVPEDYCPIRENGGEYLYNDGIKVAYRPESSLYFDQIVHPFEACESETDIDHVPLTAWTEQDLDFMVNEIKTLHETTDKAILFAFGGNIFEAGQLDFGYEAFYTNLLIEPDMMHYYFNRITDIHLSNLERLLARAGKYLQVVQFGDDLGTQQAQQISTTTYRNLIKPYHARQFRFVQNHYPAVRVFLHSCGAIEPLIPDLIDAGVQVLNPVQLSARGMNPMHLKKEYGHALSFWGGGSNTSETMTNASPEQVRQESAALLEIFAPGGGYVFNQVHNIQPGVPMENILAAYDAALSYRKAHRRG
ncbi:MAG: uroporphyrinogen decarboxylase family protein [Clostridia bacterium]